MNAASQSVDRSAMIATVAPIWRDTSPPTMPCSTHLLRDYGLRVTPQRVLLVDVVRSLPDHFTAEDVYRQMARTYPSISVVSVYRGLETLRRLGLVTRTELGENSAAYEWALGKRHHHLVCRRCGMVQQLADEELDALRDQLQARHGFHAAIDHYAIFGLCAECASSDAEVHEDTPQTQEEQLTIQPRGGAVDPAAYLLRSNE
jgi:Fur family ferric uptake transcriptional regulator